MFIEEGSGCLRMKKWIIKIKNYERILILLSTSWYQVSRRVADIMYACRSYRYSAIKRETIWKSVMSKQVLGVSCVWQHPCCC